MTKQELDAAFAEAEAEFVAAAKSLKQAVDDNASDEEQNRHRDAQTRAWKTLERIRSRLDAVNRAMRGEIVLYPVMSDDEWQQFQYAARSCGGIGFHVGHDGESWWSVGPGGIDRGDTIADAMRRLGAPGST